jgi:ribonuclease HI
VDAYIWPHNKNGTYSAKSGYGWLISQHDSDMQASSSWSWIWRLKVPEKFKFLIWLACHNAVPTLTLLHHRNMINSAICSRCGDQEETLFHCLRDCKFSAAIWRKIGFFSLHFFSATSIADWLREGVNCPRSAAFLAGLWWIWRHWNSMCLGNVNMSETQLSINIHNTADSISSAFRNIAVAAPPPRIIRWNNNNGTGTILNVDGSCCGDPVRAGFGGVLRINSGTYITGFSGYISHSQDILFAELTALYQGLKLAVSFNFGEVTCYSDSILTVNLIKEELNHFHVYAVLIQNIKDIMRSRPFSLFHSLREGNQCADFMAKLGASNDVELTIHSSPPEELLPLLKKDELRTCFLRH